jgi:hypothetical protein
VSSKFPLQLLPLEINSDYARFSEAIESLLTLALIKRDRVSRTFSLHRLVQESFKCFMPAEEKQRAFNNACILISKAFPRRAQTWPSCTLCGISAPYTCNMLSAWKIAFAKRSRLIQSSALCKPTAILITHANGRFILSISDSQADG